MAAKFNLSAPPRPKEDQVRDGIVEAGYLAVVSVSGFDKTGGPMQLSTNDGRRLYNNDLKTQVPAVDPTQVSQGFEFFKLKILGAHETRYALVG